MYYVIYFFKTIYLMRFLSAHDTYIYIYTFHKETHIIIIWLHILIVMKCHMINDIYIHPLVNVYIATGNHHF